MILTGVGTVTFIHLYMCGLLLCMCVMHTNKFMEQVAHLDANVKDTFNIHTPVRLVIFNPMVLLW